MKHNSNKFNEELSNLVNNKLFIDVFIRIGYINKQGIMNTNIKRGIYNRFKKFLLNNDNDNNMKELTKYYYRDLQLIVQDDIKYAIRVLPSKVIDFLIPNQDKTKLNYSYLRLITENNRLIDITHFPFIIEYDNIEVQQITTHVMKYKNSELFVEFIENNDNLQINVKSKIDIHNIDNFMNNFQFFINKLHIDNIDLGTNFKN